ncbi:MAG: dienelactone hydrolase family protein [Clostridia bacterium]|nr:dienelactone hydrolase family protein [Clostridia bacterium]
MIYKGNKIFEDTPTAADEYRLGYIKGIEDYILRKNSESQAVRESLFEKYMLAGRVDEYRKIYRDMLGLSAFEGQVLPPTECILAGCDDVCDIYRLRVYITPEIPMYAMLFLPRATEAVPLVVAQHGGGGTPELCSDLVGKNNYNNMVRRVLERGAAVIAPQLLLWSISESETMRAHNIPYERRDVDNALKHIGTSITALEISGIMRCIDYAIALPGIEASKIGMIGASYGGYFTLHTMAADERIKAGYVACVFNDRDVYGWGDFVYRGSAALLHDAEVASLCAPRKLYISVGKDDRVFNYRYAIEEGERAKKYFERLGCPESLRFSVWDGGHTVEDSDEGYDFMFSALK